MKDYQTPFQRQLNKAIADLGGMHNAHLHLDRAGTLEERYLTVESDPVLNRSDISLHEKHHLIYQVHSGPAYEDDDLRRRINFYLDHMSDVGTRRADSLVDVTNDGLGNRAMRLMLSIAEQRQDIELNVAAYSPFGFRDDEPQRWRLFEEASKQCQFIAALPEADDRLEYPAHIGFQEHMLRCLDLAKGQKKMLHVHLDQRNDPREDGTEQLIEVLDNNPSISADNDEAWIWAVHMISPTTYEDDRFQRLLDGLLRHRIGLICCPSAAIGMRQLRPLRTPTDNSIPRVLEYLDAGVPVRIASDNIADICSPSTTADLRDEVFVLSAALRFYHVQTLAKLACGMRLDEDERGLIAEHLKKNAAQVQSVTSRPVA